MGEQLTSYPGKLIAFEGIDGSGKTTQAALLSAFLINAGKVVITSKEPTDGRWGQLIRKSSTEERLPIGEEVEAFIKDRKAHVEDLIKPNLKRGAFVLVDRYFLSTAAYQGARGLDPESLMRRNEEFAPLPDLAVILEIDVETAVTRINKRGYGKNLFELSQNLRLVKTCFESLDRPYISRINGANDRWTVFEELMNELTSRSIVPRTYLTSERMRAVMSVLDS
jgi:dTMP kinase